MIDIRERAQSGFVACTGTRSHTYIHEPLPRWYTPSVPSRGLSHVSRSASRFTHKTAPWPLSGRAPLQFTIFLPHTLNREKLSASSLLRGLPRAIHHLPNIPNPGTRNQNKTSREARKSFPVELSPKPQTRIGHLARRETVSRSRKFQNLSTLWCGATSTSASQACQRL